jgi:predicted nucleotidyltransferase component of viral defense system
VSTGSGRRRWGGIAHLTEILEAQPGGMEFAARDFALITLAGELASAYPGQLVFMGGFVLRHGYGHLRFSKDVDATRHDPPAHKFDAAAMATTIMRASILNVIKFAPAAPGTDSANSLDFNAIRVSSDLFRTTSVQVEVSYREAVIGEPVPKWIGHPFYEPFELLTMEPGEMAAEKIRTLAQRQRATDLADLTVLLMSLPAAADERIARFAVAKFEQVKQGRGNRVDRILATIEELVNNYDATVPQLFHGAPDYRTAKAVVWPRIKPLIP